MRPPAPRRAAAALRPPNRAMRRALLAAVLLALPVPGPAGEYFTLVGHGGPVMDIAVDPTGRIATASFDNSAALWEAQAPTFFDGHAAAVTAVIFAGGGLVSASDDFTLRRWPSGETLGRHQGKVTSLVALPGGGVASGSWDGSIGLWPPAGAPAVLDGHEAGVNDLALSADGRRLYSASADGSVRLWDLDARQEIRQLIRHGFGINRIVLDEAAGWLAYGAVDGVTRIVDAQTAAPIADLTLDRRPILAMAPSPDGRLLAVGDGEGYIMVVGTGTWQIAKDFRAARNGPIWALAFSPDGQNILAGGLDPAVHSWPLSALGDAPQLAAERPGYLRNPDTMENGERQFARKCSICHTLSPDGGRRAGPTLYGLFGRPSGTVPGYAYSGRLDRGDITWNETTIDALFAEGPDHYIPGSKMPMQKIADPQDRTDLIAFLRRATKPKGETE